MGGVSVAAAIVVGLVSSFVQSLGLTIQRKSHVQEETLPLSLRRRPIRRPLWLLGFGIYITSNIFSTIFQLDALPIVILAPLGAVSLIYNALLARLILGDTFGGRAVIGTGLVAVGAVLIAVFGVVQEGEHRLDELLVLFSRPAFVAFFTIVGTLTTLAIIAAHIASWSVHRQIRSGAIFLPGTDTPPDSCPVSNYASPRDPAPIPFRPSLNTRRWSAPIPISPRPSRLTLQDDSKHVRFTPVVPSPSPPKSHAALATLDEPPFFPLAPTPSPAQQHTLTLAGLAFAAASGVLSGMSLVLAKAAVELLIITIEHFRTGKGENQFVRAQSWFLLVGLITGGLLQLVYLNYSLTFASPALICPLAFCFFNLSSIFDGLVFYDQFGRLAHYQIALVSVGVATLLVGVWTVSAIQPTGDGGVDVGTWIEEEEDEEDKDETQEGQVVDEHTTLLGHPHSAEPENINDDDQTHLHHTQDRPSPRTPPPDLHITSPPPPLFSPTLTSPTSPLSPTSRQQQHRRRRNRSRYGTLIPELAPVGAPTGFSIGLGAASPGFVLRPAHGGSVSLSGPEGFRGRRVRSRSEGTGGIEAIMRGGLDGGGSAGAITVHATGTGGAETQIQAAPAMIAGENEIMVRPDVNGQDQVQGETSSNHGRSRFNWLSRIFGNGQGGEEEGRKGRIRLDGDDGV